MIKVKGKLTAVEWDCENLCDGELLLREDGLEIDLYALLMASDGKRIEIKIGEEE